MLKELESYINPMIVRGVAAQIAAQLAGATLTRSGGLCLEEEYLQDKIVGISLQIANKIIEQTPCDADEIEASSALV